MLKRTCLLFILCGWTLITFAQNTLSYSEAIATAKELEDPEDTVARLDSLIQQAEAEGIPDTVALIHHLKGVSLYATDVYAAIEATQKAIEIRKTLHDTLGLSRSYYNTARYYQLVLAQLEKAVPFFEKIVELGNSPANINYQISMVYLGWITRDLGDYARAIQYCNLALSLYEQNKDWTSEDSLVYAQVLYTLGGVYNELDTKQDLAASLDYLKQAQAILEAFSPDRDLAECYKEIGNSYSGSNEHHKAIAYYEKTLPIYRADDSKKELAGSFENIGIQYRKLGDYTNSARNLRKGLGIMTGLYGSGFHPAKASFADNLADTYRDQQLFDRAMQYYQQAIQHILPSFNPQRIADNPSKAQLEEASRKEELLTYLGDKARGWLSYHEVSDDPQQLQLALNTLLQADYLIDRMRQEHTAEASKLIWRRKVHSIYERALNIAYQLSDKKQAFYFLEKSKSILLLDGLVAADARAIIPDSIAAQERSLNQSILDLQAELEDKPDDPALRTRLLDQQGALVALVAYLADTYPRYHELRYTSSVLSLEEAQQRHASARRLLVQYFWGDEHMYIMPVAAKSTQLLRIPRDSTFEQTLQSLIGQFQDASAILNDPGQYVKDAYAAYKLLLAPVFAVMPDTEASELCLVLDGLLQYVPFEALLTNDPKRINLSTLPYLVRRYNVQYAYSMTILDKQSKKGKQKANEAAVLGMAPFAAAGGELGQLPFSADELNGIRKLAAGKYLMNKDANSDAFLQAATKYAVLHLSTHASANEEGGKPFIYFHDQKVFLPDLYALELPAQLVVLSACETGLGKLQTGEGVMSLSRGFAFAGAQSLISSLWSVNDQSTADIFTEFYDQLGTGLRKSKALHNAKLAYLNNTKLTDDQKSPYYWAGFVYIGGDSRLPLHPAQGARWWWWASAGLLLLVGFRWWTRRS